MYTLEESDTSPLCIPCTLVPQIIPLSKLMFVRMWYGKSNPWRIMIEWFLLTYSLNSRFSIFLRIDATCDFGKHIP